MENKEKSAELEVLTLTALEFLAGLRQQVSEEIWNCLLSQVSKRCPAELLYEEAEGKPSRSFEYDSQRTVIGIIVDETVWSLETVPNPDKQCWNDRMEWVKQQMLGGKQATIPTLPEIHSLSRNWSKVQQTVKLLRLFGVKVDDFKSGKYLTISGSKNEGVYPCCNISAGGWFETDGVRSKLSLNDDIVRLVRKVD